MFEKELAEYLRKVCLEVMEKATVKPGEPHQGVVNETGMPLLTPDGRKSYHAFWVRDSAMSAGAGLVKAELIEGWVRLIASTQNGPETKHLSHGLKVPAYSIPDHINFNGKPVWYPGTYSDTEDQGTGDWGIYPPLDDAFYFIHLVYRLFEERGKETPLSKVTTSYGENRLIDVCEKAFDSVSVDPEKELVFGGKEPDAQVVDWGFCDTVRKSGLFLFPSLLRYRAARELAEMFASLGNERKDAQYRLLAEKIQNSINETFYHRLETGEAWYISATGKGNQDDVWGTALAAALRIPDASRRMPIARGLLSGYRKRRAVMQGAVRHLLTTDTKNRSGWEKTMTPLNRYQNGAYWGVPAGWYICGMSLADEKAAEEMFREYVDDIRENRDKGAPWECIFPEDDYYKCPDYVASVATPYLALKEWELI